jgi:hypothetical protein
MRANRGHLRASRATALVYVALIQVENLQIVTDVGTLLANRGCLIEQGQ